MSVDEVIFYETEQYSLDRDCPGQYKLIRKSDGKSRSFQGEDATFVNHSMCAIYRAYPLQVDRNKIFDVFCSIFDHILE
jgi:hypothetical protein